MLAKLTVVNLADANLQLLDTLELDDPQLLLHHIFAEFHTLGAPFLNL